MPPRKIAVFTGNRAEYGLQFPIVRAIAQDPRLKHYLLVGGAHLEQDFGKTIAEIAKDGFKVYRQVDMTMPQDTLYATAQAIGSGILSVSRILEELRPDWMLVYADRFESFAALIASTQMGIPTAHAEGGDYTEGGALDDTVRHAMTKLAHLHFTTNEQASERIRRMGEEPWRVHTVGYPALDLVAAGEFASLSEIERDLKLDPTRPVFIFCQHSVTTEADLAAKQIRPSIAALKKLARAGARVIATYPNNDAGGRRIVAELKRGLADASGVELHQSLGRHRFHGLLNWIGRKGRGAFLGNSSAVIKETPAFGCPAVNIGSRQEGRLRAENVLDVPHDAAAIRAAALRAAGDEKFRARCARCKNPYGAGDAGRRIAEILASSELGPKLIQKKMTY